MRTLIATWPEKLGFRLHLLAWRLIRWSLMRRLRSLGYDLARWKGEWRGIALADSWNNKWMHQCQANLEVGEQLLVERRMAGRASDEPSLATAVMLRDPDRFLSMANHLLAVLEITDGRHFGCAPGRRAPVPGTAYAKPRPWHEGIPSDT